MNSSRIFVTLFFFFVLNSFTLAQTSKWVLKEIIHGKSNKVARSPDKVDVDVNSGVLEFSIPHKTNCTEKYRFSYQFSQDMSALSIPDNSGEFPSYPYEFTFEVLGRQCFDYSSSSFKNPWMKAANDASGSSSYLKGALRKEGKWKYDNKGFDFITERSDPYYAHKASQNTLSGTHRGQFKVTGPRINDAKYYRDTYGNVFTEFYFIINGYSGLGGNANAFLYEVVFVYQLLDASQVPDTDSPCDIQKPDCSCCPGTIPVWNFNTNKGECMCPEGQEWDRMNNRCVDIKNE